MNNERDWDLAELQEKKEVYLRVNVNASGYHDELSQFAFDQGFHYDDVEARAQDIGHKLFMANESTSFRLRDKAGMIVEKINFKDERFKYDKEALTHDEKGRSFKTWEIIVIKDEDKNKFDERVRLIAMEMDEIAFRERKAGLYVIKKTREMELSLEKIEGFHSQLVPTNVRTLKSKVMERLADYHGYLDYSRGDDDLAGAV